MFSAWHPSAWCKLSNPWEGNFDLFALTAAEIFLQWLRARRSKFTFVQFSCLVYVVLNPVLLSRPWPLTSGCKDWTGRGSDVTGRQTRNSDWPQWPWPEYSSDQDSGWVQRSPVPQTVQSSEGRCRAKIEEFIGQEFGNSVQEKKHDTSLIKLLLINLLWESEMFKSVRIKSRVF